jgi:peroxiredoxin
VLGIDSLDSTSDARRFVRAQGITYPVVSDPDGLVAANRYDVVYLPVTYVLDRRGRIVGGQVLGPISDHTLGAEFSRYFDAARTS